MTSHGVPDFATWPHSLLLPIERRGEGVDGADSRLYFEGTHVTVETFLGYVIGHGPRECSLHDFLRDFPQVTERQAIGFVELVHRWAVRTPYQPIDRRNLWNQHVP